MGGVDLELFTLSMHLRMIWIAKARLHILLESMLVVIPGMYETCEKKGSATHQVQIQNAFPAPQNGCIFVRCAMASTVGFAVSFLRWGNLYSIFMILTILFAIAFLIIRSIEFAFFQCCGTFDSTVSLRPPNLFPGSSLSESTHQCAREQDSYSYCSSPYAHLR